MTKALDGKVVLVTGAGGGIGRDIALMARACVNMAEQSTLETGVRYERQMYHALYGLPAQQEGMNAFLEKRKPNWVREV